MSRRSVRLCLAKKEDPGSTSTLGGTWWFDVVKRERVAGAEETMDLRMVQSC